MRWPGISIALALILAPAGRPADRFPATEAENLLGKKMVLPDALNGHATVLIIGFTHASQSQMKAWDKRLEADQLPYSIAVLQDVPRLVRPMAIKGIKGDVPDAEKDRYLLVFHGEKELKESAGFAAPNDAYVLLLDANGSVQWKFHGAPSDNTVQDLEIRLHATN